MVCYSPMHSRIVSIRSDGKKVIRFYGSEHYALFRSMERGVHPKDLDPDYIAIPCGQCIGCRMARSREWALRCIHEAQMHDDNSFVTLTYSPEHLPSDGSLDKTHVQKFLKRLRKVYNFRYYYCGEYGSKGKRPHYHILFFGYRPDDLKVYQKTRGIILYFSQYLEDLWAKGFVTVGDVTYQSAAYTARYIMKKMLGRSAKDYYTRIDPCTGEVYEVLPEYTNMSLKPGIGHDWYQKYKSDCFPSDYLINEGKKLNVPKYYGRLFERESPLLFEDIKSIRVIKAQRHKMEQTVPRLRVKQEIQEVRLSKLHRGYENDI